MTARRRFVVAARWTARLTLLPALLVAGLAGPASAVAPVQIGWWTATNLGLAAIPEPGVPSGGLLVRGGPTSPTAYAALVYVVPAGAATLTLTLTAADGTVVAPTTALELCPLTGTTIAEERGGPMADAPTYDCSRKLTAGVGADGKSFVFDCGTFVRSDLLSVAVLPTTAVERIALEAPSASSLTAVVGTPTASAPRTAASATRAPAPRSTAPAPSPTPSAALGGAPVGPTVELSQPPAVTTTAAATGPAPVVAPDPADAVASAAPLSPASVPQASVPRRHKSHHAVVGIGLLAAALLGATAWALAGRPEVPTDESSDGDQISLGPSRSGTVHPQAGHRDRMRNDG